MQDDPGCPNSLRRKILPRKSHPGRLQAVSGHEMYFLWLAWYFFKKCYQPLKIKKYLSKHTHTKRPRFLRVCACAQSCLSLCGCTDCSPPGSSVHGIFQARLLPWVADHRIFLTQGLNLSLFCLLLEQADSLPLASPGKPIKKK